MEELLSITSTAAPLKNPFQKIAMALSGGGYRAASYSIGVMSYLHEVKYSDDKSLLENVEFISSASGGSFAAMLYVAYIKKGLAFKDVYNKLTGFMSGTNSKPLLDRMAEELNDDDRWVEGGKSRNLINAFARIYDRDLFGEETFEVYWKNIPGRTLEICVNATEFYRGLSFRWQTAGEPFGTKWTSMTGNNYIFFNKETNEDGFKTLQKIKLGDIMASSSCFPGGFEPIVYPRDFTYQGMTAEMLNVAMTITNYDGKRRQLDTPVGLMDGGVDDNQGLYSAMLADKRKRGDNNGEGFDLIMVVDVASYFMDPYVPPATTTKGTIRKQTLAGSIRDLHGKFNSLSKWVKAASFISLGLLAAAILLLVFADTQGWMNMGYLLLSPSILVLLIVAFITGYKSGNPLFSTLNSAFTAKPEEVVAYIKESVPAVDGFSDNFMLSLIKALKGARFGVLEQMVKARLGSVLSMVMDINLKQTRRLIFDIFYGRFYGSDFWQHRRVFDVIYELSEYNAVNRDRNIREKFDSKDVLKVLLEGCEKLQAVAEPARTMGTTLWYDAEDTDSQRMKKVIACGQFTTCAKLLEYVYELEMSMTIQDAHFKRVKEKLVSDWEAFKKDPYWMYKDKL